MLNVHGYHMLPGHLNHRLLISKGYVFVHVSGKFSVWRIMAIRHLPQIGPGAADPARRSTGGRRLWRR
jgi:hypothetical protein